MIIGNTRPEAHRPQSLI